MNKIRFIVNPDTNYIFHMLSVANCGYDNEYGKCYRNIYPQEDLAMIKKNEELLTVRGGEHCGALCSTLVFEPACARISAKEYYWNLIDKIENYGVSNNMEEYREIIYHISEVMVKHYDFYIENIWSKEREKMNQYIPEVLRLFEDSNFTEKAESVVGSKLSTDCFAATLVTSVEGGAEAIDISKEQDVFGIERSPLDAFYFIGHEFIIYLLFDVLKEENAFKELCTWNITEGLAEFYLKQIMGDTRFFNSQHRYVEFFEECCRLEQLTAVELYKKALEWGKYDYN